MIRSREEQVMEIEYRDDDSIPSYGMYRCRSCESEFYGGGPALHNKGCKTPGYDNVVFVCGPKSLRNNSSSALWPVSVTVERIREVLP